MIIKERKIRETLKNPNSIFNTPYGTMLTYYKIFDMLHGTHHLDILHILYECEQIYTIDGIALRCHVSRRTLDRNRKEYLECFTVCKSLGAIFSETAATSI